MCSLLSIRFIWTRLFSGVTKKCANSIFRSEHPVVIFWNKFKNLIGVFNCLQLNYVDGHRRVPDVMNCSVVVGWVVTTITVQYGFVFSVLRSGISARARFKLSFSVSRSVCRVFFIACYLLRFCSFFSLSLPPYMLNDFCHFLFSDFSDFSALRFWPLAYTKRASRFSLILRTWVNVGGRALCTYAL